MSETKDENIADQQLLDRYSQTRDNRWLGTLLERHTLFLYGVCKKMLGTREEAQDIVQQVCIKAITKVEKYQIDHFRAWLYAIALNECHMVIRSKRKLVLELASTDDSLELAAERNRRKEELEQPLESSSWEEKILEALPLAIKELKPAQRECVNLFYLHHLTYQEIAVRTGTTTNQVKSNIQNAKRNLKNILEGFIPPP